VVAVAEVAAAVVAVAGVEAFDRQGIEVVALEVSEIPELVCLELAY
jgi:hypothetical protein